ncbi:hypothetical protein [Streptomyces canus]|uniref:hypothetical protein n=1 Tax=Streptomyces canus TaxID=58343 RepID=UPI0003681739|nr:hypothetical protein [Streptomyces canus]
MSGKPHALRIGKRTDGPGWTAELDGQDIAPALRSLSLSVDSSPVATARLDLVIEDVSTHAEVDVWMPDATKDLLVRLGWTPPAEEATP